MSNIALRDSSIRQGAAAALLLAATTGRAAAASHLFGTMTRICYGAKRRLVNEFLTVN
jgi:hypothetical protein